MTQREIDDSVSAVCKVAHGIPLPDLEKLCNAWRDDRAVILPCKVGDTVYTINNNYICPVKIAECLINLNLNGTFQSYFSYTDKLELAGILNDDFGKTAFLTRAEAEAALKEADKHE